MERVARHYDKLILTLILCLAILFIATFSPFAQKAEAVGVIAPALIAIVVAGLAAVGITFVTTGSFSSLNDYVESLLIEYAASRNLTPNELFRGCQSSSDKLGRLLLNNTFVQLISTFATWLISRYDLTNNSDYTLQSGDPSVGEMVVYKLPFVITFTDTNIFTYYVVDYDGDGEAYVSLCIAGRWNTVYARVITEYEGGTVRFYTHDNSTGNNINESTKELSNVIGDFYWAQYDMRSANALPSGYTAYSEADWNRIMANGELTPGGAGIRIKTSILNPPLDDEDYTDGDGAIIDVGADWGTTYDDITDVIIPGDYSASKEGEAEIEYTTEDEIVEEIESTSEVSNLPSGTIPFSPDSLPEIHLSSIWHYVAQWIQDTAIAAGSLMAIVVQNPSPMVNLFYATVCLAIIFGLIKGFAK